MRNEDKGLSWGEGAQLKLPSSHPGPQCPQLPLLSSNFPIHMGTRVGAHEP